MSSQNRINESMPLSSLNFLHFKWWRCPGIDAAVWFVHKEITSATLQKELNRSISKYSDIQLSKWLVPILSLGQPSVINRLSTGTENIWITDKTLIQEQTFVQLLRHFSSDKLQIAGIIINRTDGSDRPDSKMDDYCLDVIITFTTFSSTLPIYHRERIPQWSTTQRSTIGRYTTGPLFSAWSKI